MIYVTGDLHGEFGRFKEKAYKKLKKEDTLIVCGDFGFVWNGDAAEQKILQKIGAFKYRVLFIEGTHDNIDLLNQYEEVDFCGGRAHHICGNLYHLMRGNVYEIESKYIFTFGGGESADMDIREEGKTWWPQELPTKAEIAAAENKLNQYQNAVDYMITHESSGIVKEFLDMDHAKVNYLNAFFSKLSKQCRYKKWFFGSYHLDKAIAPNQICVYEQLMLLE